MVPLQERENVLNEMEKTYRIFIGRSFQVPSLQWNDRVILNDIRQHHPALFKEKGEEMREILNEYQHAGPRFGYEGAGFDSTFRFVTQEC